MTQFSYNLQWSESIGCTPFELVTGQRPQTPHSLSAAFQGKSLGVYHLAKGWKEQLDTDKSYLDKAAKKMEKFANRKRHPTDYKVGDMVLVKFNLRQFKALRGIHQNLVRKYEGPFRIVAKVGKISYKVELPPYFTIHPVFHASVLKPYHEDKGDLSETFQNSHRLLSLPCMIGKLNPLLTIKPRESEVNNLVPCCSFIGRDNLRRRPHGSDTKTCGNSKTESGSSYRGNAPRSSHH
ncbi:hypothetical protein KY290_031206 [Solanum tuberosum]|uniref:Tf2-1-like SH3-like domain-containing protein n=1 Tax=Solanum tuberosum TaxID=4113 RepID=A0ABQ7U9Q8_SOLTU|nr:hypothetical protein KY290_031206 [Solanum tuberosum]